MRCGGGPLFCTLEAGSTLLLWHWSKPVLKPKLECEVLRQQTQWLRKGGAVI